MLVDRFGEGCYIGGGEATVLVHLADSVVEEIPGEKLAANHNRLLSTARSSSESSSVDAKGKTFFLKL